MNKKQRQQLRNAIETNDLGYIKTLLSTGARDWLTIPLNNYLRSFQLAASLGLLEMVQLFLAEVPSLLNSKDVMGQTAVLWAAANGHEPLVDFLANCGADLTLATRHHGDEDHDKSPLCWAVKHKHYHVVQCLISHGADINRRYGENKLHLIHIAAEAGFLSVVQTLLGIDLTLLNLVDEGGHTPINFAATEGQWHVVDYLANLGADLTLAEKVSGYDLPPLFWAAGLGFHNVVRCLINHGADINLRYSKDKMHLIHLASQKGHFDVVSLLLDINPALVNLKDNREQTPVAYAIGHGHEQLVKYLTKRGADLRVARFSPGKECHEYLPIHRAVETGNLVIFQYLRRFHTGDDLIVETMRYQLIHIAALHGQLEMVKFFVNENHDCLEYVDCYGQTPLLLAVIAGHDEVVRYLIAEGANIEVSTKRPGSLEHEKTALKWAMDKQHHTIANLLILKSTAHQDKSAILPLITNQTQAFELMIQEPTLIKTLLQEERIANLVVDKKSGSSKTINWYKKAGRRGSIFAQINKETGEVSIYKPVAMVGEGAAGKVRKFQSAKGGSFAVKSPLRLVESQELDKMRTAVMREAIFNKLAYPADSLNEVLIFVDTGKNNQKYYSNRYVMSFVEGEQSHDFIASIDCEYQLARVVLAMAKELDRIHSLGILHFDIHRRNLLIKEVNSNYIVRIVDFGSAYFMHEEKVKTWVSRRGDPRWYSPEVCSKDTKLPNPKPNPRQDVYSLGYLLNKVFENHPCRLQLTKLFPSISTFISEAQSTNPKKRPTLADFCQQLTKELNPKNNSQLTNSSSFFRAMTSSSSVSDFSSGASLSSSG